MSLAVDAEQFFSQLASDSDAYAHLENYALVVHLVAPEERLMIELAGRQSKVHQATDPAIGLWDLELQGSEDALRTIFAGALTLGQAIYRGRIFVPEEKSKHNLVCALGQAIRVTQERTDKSAPRESHSLNAEKVSA